MERADAGTKPEQLRNTDVAIKQADESEQKPAYSAETPVFQEVSDIPIKVGEAEVTEQPSEVRPLKTQLSEKLTQALEQGESLSLIHIWYPPFGPIFVLSIIG